MFGGRGLFVGSGGKDGGDPGDYRDGHGTRCEERGIPQVGPILERFYCCSEYESLPNKVHLDFLE